MKIDNERYMKQIASKPKSIRDRPEVRVQDIELPLRLQQRGETICARETLRAIAILALIDQLSGDLRRNFCALAQHREGVRQPCDI